ncbi:MAG TPA: hypothetical protein DEP35_19035 [Deltaproteobacteria bacterium]|jgi:hypothetical protein|nr:hypothetical protein [Deltaproteobacteria bacterium]
MVHDHLASHRLDRRLLRRRNWVNPKQLAKELEALPDVSEKIRPPEEGQEAAEEAKGPAEAFSTRHS